MDFLECPDCSKRFVVPNAGPGEGWFCPDCRAELSLVVRSLPGEQSDIARALRAKQLDQSEPSAPDAGGGI